MKLLRNCTVYSIIGAPVREIKFRNFLGVIGTKPRCFVYCLNPSEDLQV